MSNFKSGIIKAIREHNGRVMLGFFRGDKEKALKEGKTQQFWLVTSPTRQGNMPHEMGKEWKGDFFKGGDKLPNAAGDLVDTYYQEDSLEGHQDLNSGASRIKGSFCDKSDTIEALVLSFEQALMVSSAAARASGKEGMNHEQWFDRIVATARAKSRVTK